MNINQLIEIIEQKILSQDCILKVDVQDKSFLHKNHKSNVEGKFHILLLIKSPELKVRLSKFCNSALIRTTKTPMVATIIPSI